MGIRAHVVKKHVCEYSGSSNFNYEAERVWQMLTDNDVEICIGCACGCDCYYGDWTINGTEPLKRYIAQIETLPPDEVNEYFDAQDADHQDYTNQSVKEILEEWVSHYDETVGMIRIHWF